MFVPVNEPLIPAESKKYLYDAVETWWISSAWSYISKFEQKFAEYIWVKHAITVSNWTNAIHLALLWAWIWEWDEVIVPSFTMMWTYLPILYVWAIPIFVDVESDTYNIDVSRIENKITNKTKAILPVHIYGHSVDMDPILELAKKYGLKVIEDAAEIHGGEYKWKKCGSLSDISAFSFYWNKIITTWEWWMVCTNDDTIANAMRKYKDLYHSDIRFIHEKIGYNYRMTNMQAAIWLWQMENIHEFIKKKEYIASFYNSELNWIKGLILPMCKNYAKHVYWMYSILVTEDFVLSKDEFRKKLKEWWVDTRDFFYPPNIQPVLIDYYKKNGYEFDLNEMKVAIHIANNWLYLPSWLALTDEQLKHVVYTIKKLYYENK